MKKHFTVITGILLLSIALSLGGNFFVGKAQNENKETVAQTIQGEQAIENLKQNGEYDSLAEDVKQARIAESQTESSQAATSIYRQQAKLIASDGDWMDHLGRSVAISGDTAVVGTFEDDVNGNIDQGSAYIFVRSGTTWTQQAHLIASDGAAQDRFGYSVSISGNSVIIGTEWAKVGANSEQGAAYVFVRPQFGTSWSQQAKLTASDGAVSDHFGSSVAISGSNVIVGAIGDDVNGISQGAAYIFVRGGTIWTEEQHIFASDGADGDGFGRSVAISVTTAIVSSPYKKIGANFNQGAAYVFTRVTGNTWTQQQKLTTSDVLAFAQFGNSVAISGDTVIIGDDPPQIASQNNRGSAFIFTRSGIIWTQQARLIDPDGRLKDEFGISVSISGETAIVGAPFKDFGANEKQGAAFIFTRSGTTWTSQKILHENPLILDAFGYAVAISNTTVIGGAIAADVSIADQGAAYIFTLSNAVSPFDFDGDGKTDVSIFRPSNGQWWYSKSSDSGNYAATFGNSTDKLVPGDFTGDGKADIAIFRPSTGEWFILRSEDGSYYSYPFGTNGDLPAVGDFDADGKADSAIFRPSDTNWYIRRSSDGGTTIQQFGANGDVPAVADYDGDGKSDIAIWRTSAGQWWIQKSSNSSVVAFTFGNNADKPVQGDYTGDGKADVAIFRPSTGEWFILRSENQSYYSFPFGTTGDIPAPGDFDGDGRFDATVFRPSGSTWYVQRSSAGTLIQNFGVSGDKPVSGAFIP